MSNDISDYSAYRCAVCGNNYGFTAVFNAGYTCPHCGSGNIELICI